MKKLFALLLAAMMVFSITACTPTASDPGDNPGGSDTDQPQGQVQQVSMSSPMSTGTFADGGTAICEGLSEVTGGAINGTFFGNNSLGNQRDMVNAMAAGELELILDGSVPVDLFAPEYGFLVAPYLIRSMDHLQNIVENSDIWKDFEAKLADNGILILGVIYRGSRQTASDGAIDWDNPASCIIRMPDVATYVEAWSAIGTNTQVMGGGDVYSALQNGVVNTCEGPWEQHVSMAIPEVCDTLYQTDHCQEFYCVYASKTWFESLSEENQQAIRDLVSEQCAIMNAAAEEESDGYLQQLLDAGMTLEDVDTAPLFERVTPVWEEKFESGEWTSSYDEIMSYNG